MNQQELKKEYVFYLHEHNMMHLECVALFEMVEHFYRLHENEPGVSISANYDMANVNAQLKEIEERKKLAESEDERIRKALIEVFKEKLERGFEWVEYGIPNRSVLSWLEKQKEPHFTKRNALFDKCVENCDPEIMKRVSDEVDAMLQKEKKSVQSNAEKEYVRTLKSLISDFLRGKEEVDREYYQQIFDWLDGRHIEQKPAEWGKNDTVFLNEITDFFENKTVRLQHDLDMYARWLKSLPEGFNLQPKQEWSEDIIQKAVKEVGLTQHQIDWFKTNVFPLKVEWSEEDEGELQNAIDALEFLGKKGVYKSESGYDAALQAASWLENLLERCNLQPEQEWGEDNDKDIAHIIRVLNDCYEYGKHDLSKTDYENLVGTVKFLRNRPKPSDTWKPSEEQMKWLKDVIETVPMTCRQQGPLESLYNDLLKLSNDCINTYHRTFIQEL